MANIATIPEAVKTMQAQITQWMPAIKEMLPQHVTPERMLRLARSMLANNHKLATCTPLSLMTALCECSLLGLEPNTPLGHAWVIPFGNEATLVPGYKGYLELFYRTGGVVSGVNADVVCENDFFDYQLGPDGYIKHRYAEGERGKLRYAYAYALVHGNKVFKVLPASEVLKHKGASRAAQSGSRESPWNNEWEPEMWKKTAILVLADILPKSREVADMQCMDRRDQGLDAGRTLVEDLVADANGNTKPAAKLPQDAPPNKQSPAKAAPQATDGPQTPPDAPGEPRRAANRRPSKAKAEEAPPPPPPDDEPPPMEDTDDAPPPPAPHEPEEESQEDRETRRLLLAQIEGFRVQIKGKTTAYDIYKSFGYKGPDDCEKETSLEKLQTVAEHFGMAVAEESKQAEEPPLVPDDVEIETVKLSRLREIGEQVSKKQLSSPQIVALAENSVRVASINPVVSRGRNLLQIGIFDGAGAPVTILLYDTPAEELKGLCKNMVVNISRIEVTLHTNNNLYYIVQKGGLQQVF